MTDEKKYLDQGGVKKVFTLVKTETDKKVDKETLQYMSIEAYTKLEKNNELEDGVFYFLYEDEDDEEETV